MVKVKNKGFVKPDFIVQLRFPPNRIDIITGISGISFAECWVQKNVITIDGMNVNFISLTKLLVNKKASGRKKDLLDYDQLVKLMITINRNLAHLLHLLTEESKEYISRFVPLRFYSI